MIVLFAVMIILLIPALWAYSYIWRGLNRRVIAAVKVVDPVITLGPYAMGCWGLLTTWVGIKYWWQNPEQLSEAILRYLRRTT